eukprot:766852-Hanusia_phi.AAC.2
MMETDSKELRAIMLMLKLLDTSVCGIQDDLKTLVSPHGPSGTGYHLHEERRSSRNEPYLAIKTRLENIQKLLEERFLEHEHGNSNQNGLQSDVSISRKKASRKKREVGSNRNHLVDVADKDLNSRQDSAEPCEKLRGESKRELLGTDLVFKYEPVMSRDKKENTTTSIIFRNEWSQKTRDSDHSSGETLRRQHDLANNPGAAIPASLARPEPNRNGTNLRGESILSEHSRQQDGQEAEWSRALLANNRKENGLSAYSNRFANLQYDNDIMNLRNLLVDRKNDSNRGNPFGA